MYTSWFSNFSVYYDNLSVYYICTILLSFLAVFVTWWLLDSDRKHPEDDDNVGPAHLYTHLLVYCPKWVTYGNVFCCLLWCLFIVIIRRCQHSTSEVRIYKMRFTTLMKEEVGTFSNQHFFGNLFLTPHPPGELTFLYLYFVMYVAVYL